MHLLGSDRPWQRRLFEFVLLLVLAFVFVMALTLVFAPPFGVLRPVVAVACALPAPFEAARWAGRDWREILGPARRVRWGLVARSLAIVSLVYVPVLGWRMWLGDVGVDKQMLLVLLAVPLQTAAEEAVFRGALPQLTGARSPWVAYGVAAVPFVALHPAGVDAAVFAACAAVLAWRTDGLEAPWALHCVGNLTFYLPLVAGAPVHVGAPWVDLAAVVLAGGLLLGTGAGVCASNTHGR